MKRTAILIGALALAPAGWADTLEIYINNAPVQAPPAIPPQIDATAFVNRSIFSINIFSIPELPYETLNTLYFTNTSSGQMFGDPGFRFNYASGNEREPMDSWVNQGRVGTQSAIFFLTGENADWLLVDATNIISPGFLSVGSQGLMRLEGDTIDLRRAGLRSGNALTNSGFFFGSSVLSDFYFNDVGITDLYWGVGTNNALGSGGQPMRLDLSFSSDSLDYQLPFPQSPVHQVLDTFGTTFRFTNLVTVPFFFSSLYDAAVFTNQLGPTNFSVQVVFYPLTSFDTNFSRSVNFFRDFADGGATVVVGFHSADFDIVSQQFFTNSVYLIDAMAYETNISLARNFDVNTRRPRFYEVTRNQPFFSFFATNGNTTFTNTLLYNPVTSVTNIVPVNYGGYSAQIASVNMPEFDPFVFFTPNPAYSDPTNFAGRIEILGDDVNLDKTRIRADTTLILRAENLSSNQLAQVDAPFIIFDVGTTEPTLVISNVAPDFVRRLNGTISAWSATWRNREIDITSTNALNTNLVINTIDYHVLMVEDNLQSLTPVTVLEFSVDGNHIIIADTIQASRKFTLDASSVEVLQTMTLPFGSSWGATNVQSLVNFTNRGLLSMGGSINLGDDRPDPYDSIVNEGTVSAASGFLRTRHFDNSGQWLSQGGLLSVKALDARLLGQPTAIFTNVFTNIFFGFTNVVTNIVTNAIGATLASSADIDMEVDDMVTSNAILRAGSSGVGALTISATNRLTDSGILAPNTWEVASGVSVLRRPAVSDLLGTTVRSTTQPFAESLHAWAAADRGAVPEGYQTNLALGKLILDARGAFSLARFAGAGGVPSALYVDFLQFDHFATNYVQALAIEPSLVIYFADSNLAAEKLDGAFGGRLRWVPFYAGPFSATNLVYSSGQVVTLNRALATSKERDDDMDGIVNFDDPEPVPAPMLSVVLSGSSPIRAMLSWNSIAFGAYRIQVKTSLHEAIWCDLTSVVNGPISSDMRFEDHLPPGVKQRFYRLQMDMP